MDQAQAAIKKIVIGMGQQGRIRPPNSSRNRLDLGETLANLAEVSIAFGAIHAD
jgi:hypothetical protein